MKNKNTLIASFLFFVGIISMHSQNLLDKLDKEFLTTSVDEIATFKTTRIGLGHSIETRKKGALQISLYNRYWNIANFEGQRFLADKVSTRYGLDYAITDNLTAGFGYTNHDKITDGYLKYKLLNQKKGHKKTFFSIALVQIFSHRKAANANVNLYDISSSSSKYAFTSQVLIARKLNSNLSLQITPSFIYRNTEPVDINDSKNQFAVGFGGRHKIGGHASIVSEYYYVANPLESIETYNTFMVGINWEVSDLMLQFHMTNARNFAEDTFITQTTNNFNAKDGNFHFGFNATFILHTRKKKLK